MARWIHRVVVSYFHIPVSFRLDHSGGKKQIYELSRLLTKWARFRPGSLEFPAVTGPRIPASWIRSLWRNSPKHTNIWISEGQKLVSTAINLTNYYRLCILLYFLLSFETHCLIYMNSLEDWWDWWCCASEKTQTWEKWSKPLQQIQQTQLEFSRCRISS